MSENNIVIPKEYKLKWLDIVLIIAKLGPERIKLLNPDVRKELFAVYYDGFDINKANGFTVNEMIVVEKPNLYIYLKNINNRSLVKQPNFQKQLKK